MRGDWLEAEREARLACGELESFRMLEFIGHAHYEIGEVRLHLGDLEGSAAAFQLAVEYGHPAQPGMALLALAQGKRREAADMIAAALTAVEGGQNTDLVNKARLLSAQAEVALASEDLATARRASEALRQLDGEYECHVVSGLAASAAGGGASSGHGIRLHLKALCNGAHARGWADAFADDGRDIPHEEIRPMIGMGGERILKRYDIAPESDEGKRLREEAVRHFKERYLPHIQAFPKVRDLLERLADAHVDDDLLQARDLHDVGQVQLLLEAGADLFVVPDLQARDLRGGGVGAGAHSDASGISAPVRVQMRTFTPSGWTR